MPPRFWPLDLVVSYLVILRDLVLSSLEDDDQGTSMVMFAENNSGSPGQWLVTGKPRHSTQSKRKSLP